MNHRTKPSRVASKAALSRQPLGAYIMNEQIIVSVGLVLDIVGVVILFFNGLPASQIFASGKHFYFVNPDQAKEKSFRIRKLLSGFAITIITIGFVLQLIGANLDTIRRIV